MIDPDKEFSEFRLHLEGADTQFKAFWTVPENMSYFAGHFPNQPILPAVGIVDATLHLFKRKLGRKELFAKSISNAKFLNPVVPKQSILVEFIEAAPQDWKVEWKDALSGKAMAILRLQLA